MAKRLKGLYRDCNPIDQPPDTYRYANNALLTEQVGAIMSDYGISAIDASNALGEGYIILGHTSINNNRVVLFTVNSDGNGSKISILNSDGSISVVIQNPALNLNFSPTSQIEATYRINQDNEVIIYWTDNINPPRSLNIDNPIQPISGDRYNIFDYVHKIPTIDLISIENSGGILSTGTYYFSVRYIDNDGNKTNFLTLSKPIYLYDDDSEDEKSDGAEPNTPTSKSIRIKIENIDDYYNEVEIAVVKKEGGTFAPTIILPTVAATGVIYYNYTGNETYIEGSLDEIIINESSYKTAKTLEQVDNVLYMGNLTKAEDIGYQKYANNIKLQVVSEKIENFLLDETPDNQIPGSEVYHTNRYKNPEISFNMKGYQRDEVYAFYISFILNDGSESKAYHIPGRVANSGEKSLVGSSINSVFGDSTLTEISNISDSAKNYHFNNTPDPVWNTGYWENENEVYPDTDDWDIWDVNSNGEGYQNGTIRNDNVRHHRMPDHRRHPIIVSNDAYVLKVKLHDLKIPKDILDKVKAVKVYYAKPNNNNKRIIDQSFTWRMFKNDDVNVTGNSEQHYISTLPIASAVTYSLTTGTLSEKGITSIPFYSLKNRDNISGVTHLQKIYVPSGTSIVSSLAAINHNNFSYYNLAKYLDSWYYSDTTFPNINNFGFNNAGSAIVSLSAKAYAPHAQNVVELKSKGFTYNATTIESESQIMMESNNENDSINWNNDSGIKEYSYISNLISHKTDVYNSFDLQELVWTGFIDTKLLKYDPRYNYWNVGSKATAEDLVIDGSIAAGTLDITITEGSTSESILVTLGAQTNNTDITASKIVSEINQNSSLITAETIPPSFFSTPSWVDDIEEARDPIDPGIPGLEPDPDPSDPDPTDPGGGDGQPEPQPIPYNQPSFDPESGTFYYQTTSDPFYVSIIKQHYTDDPIRYIITDNENEEVLEDSPLLSTDSVNILDGKNPSTDNLLYLKAKVFSSDPLYLDSETTTAFYEFAEAADSSNIKYTAKNIGPKVIKIKYSRVNYPDLLKSNFKDTTLYLEGGSSNLGHTESIGGGDTFISKYSMRISGRVIKTNNDPVNKAIVSFVAESRDNVELRHQGVNYNEIYHPKSYWGDVLKIELNQDNLDENGNKINFFDNYYGYNIDYRALQDIKTSVIYEKNRKFVKLNFPTRVIRSQENVVGSTEDNFRIFLANNYKDFQYDRGEIVKLNKYANNLILHFERAIALTRGREELATGDFRAFVGAGNIFEVEPNELLMSENGTGGIQNINHSLLTEEGYFFVDQEEESIYSLTGQGFANISDVGMRNEFEKILPWNLKQYANDFNPYTLDVRYFGINWGYDKEHSRLFFVKRDLKPSQFFIEEFNKGNIVFDKTQNHFTFNGNKIDYNYNIYFLPNNVCISFVPQLGSWISYHSFKPTYLFNNLTDLYGFGSISILSPESHSIFKYNYKETPLVPYITLQNLGGFEKSLDHYTSVKEIVYDETKDTVFSSMSATSENIIYGEVSDINTYTFDFGFVENRAPNESKMFTTLSLITSSVNSDGVETQDETFDSFRIYNNKQDSGTQTIVPFQSLASQGNARKIEGTWNINKFRNLLTTEGINTNKLWYQQDRFIGNYVEVLLTYYNSNNNFLYLTDSEVGVRKSLR